MPSDRKPSNSHKILMDTCLSRKQEGPATLGVEESTRDSWQDLQSSPLLALDGIDLSENASVHARFHGITRTNTIQTEIFNGAFKRIGWRHSLVACRRSYICRWCDPREKAWSRRCASWRPLASSWSSQLLYHLHEIREGYIYSHDGHLGEHASLQVARPVS